MDLPTLCHLDLHSIYCRYTHIQWEHTCEVLVVCVRESVCVCVEERERVCVCVWRRRERSGLAVFSCTNDHSLSVSCSELEFVSGECGECVCVHLS